MSSDSSNADNPYRSPRHTGEGSHVGSSSRSELHATLITRSTLYRHIRLAGRIEADLEWNGRWPVEYVRVNGIKVVSQHAWWYVPHFEFELHTPSETIQVAVDVRLSRAWVIVVRAFRVVVDGQVAYSEGAWVHR